MHDIGSSRPTGWGPGFNEFKQELSAEVAGETAQEFEGAGRQRLTFQPARGRVRNAVPLGDDDDDERTFACHARFDIVGNAPLAQRRVEPVGIVVMQNDAHGGGTGKRLFNDARVASPRERMTWRLAARCICPLMSA
jgi:hypothetical protein